MKPFPFRINRSPRMNPLALRMPSQIRARKARSNQLTRPRVLRHPVQNGGHLQLNSTASAIPAARSAETPRYFEAAFGVIEGVPDVDTLTTADAAEQLVDQALANRTNPSLPVKLLMLLTTHHWCLPNHESLPSYIRGHIRDRLGEAVQLIGGSMAKLFCSFAHASPRID